ncbi:hypothetical protein G6F22_017909 [Rhizopus arrhizus]|nr:hypothetical protein G6F22_017909 [Rhizopus arrhizus]
MAVTRPRRVISPVIATSARTGTLVSIDTSEVTIAAPALGPSFGVAPSGTCRCTSCFCRKSLSMPKPTARERTTDTAADADSFITLPSWPVRISWPLPGTSVDSICSRSPPTSVQARPVTRPISFSSSARPKSKRRTPRYLSRFLLDTLTSAFFLAPFFAFTGCGPASAISFTTLRQILAISRSRLRTPDSRV